MWILIVNIVLVLAFAYALYCILRAKKTITFEGKHVLITGGSSGIGENMAYIFSAMGAALTLASNQPKEVWETLDDPARSSKKSRVAASIPTRSARS